MDRARDADAAFTAAARPRSPSGPCLGRPSGQLSSPSAGAPEQVAGGRRGDAGHSPFRRPDPRYLPRNEFRVINRGIVPPDMGSHGRTWELRTGTAMRTQQAKVSATIDPPPLSMSRRDYPPILTPEFILGARADGRRAISIPSARKKRPCFLPVSGDGHVRRASGRGNVVQGRLVDLPGRRRAGGLTPDVVAGGAALVRRVALMRPARQGRSAHRDCTGIRRRTVCVAGPFVDR